MNNFKIRLLKRVEAVTPTRTMAFQAEIVVLGKVPLIQTFVLTTQQVPCSRQVQISSKMARIYLERVQEEGALIWLPITNPTFKVQKLTKGCFVSRRPTRFSGSSLAS